MENERIVLAEDMPESTLIEIETLANKVLATLKESNDFGIRMSALQECITSHLNCFEAETRPIYVNAFCKAIKNNTGVEKGYDREV